MDFNIASVASDLSSCSENCIDWSHNELVFRFMDKPLSKY